MAQPMRPITNMRFTLVFDFDGTLNNWCYDVSPQVQGMLVQRLRGKKSPDEIAKALSAPGFASAVKQFFPVSQRSQVMTWIIKRTVAQVDAGEITPPNLKSFLTVLAQSYDLAVFSARDHISLRKGLKNMGILDLFKAVEGHHGTYMPKPDPIGFLQFLESNGMPKIGAIYIGDKLSDLEMARAAGVAFIGASWLRDTLQPSDCDHLCTRLDQLSCMISDLTNRKVFRDITSQE